MTFSHFLVAYKANKIDRIKDVKFVMISLLEYDKEYLWQGYKFMNSL